MDKSKIVLAAVFDNAGAANIAKGMLEANDIPAILDGEIALNVFGIQLSPTDGIRLMVRESDLPRANALLQEHGDL